MKNFTKVFILSFVSLLLAMGNTGQAADNKIVLIKADEAPYVYSWFSTYDVEQGKNTTKEPLGIWPGTELTERAGDYWVIEIDLSSYDYLSNTPNIIINNGKRDDENKQTGIIELKYYNYFSCYEYDGESSYIYRSLYYYQPSDSKLEYIADKPFVNFQNAGWEEVYVYAWDENGNQLAGSWPGQPMNAIEDNSSYYNYAFDNGTPKAVIFNNGKSGEEASQTINLAFENGGLYNYDLGCEYVVTAPVELNPNNFPDDKFLAYLKEHLDKNSDGFVTFDEAYNDRSYYSRLGYGTVISNYNNFDDLTGIELFPQLIGLHIYNSTTESIDLSQFPRICDFAISPYMIGKTNFKSINVSKNLFLTALQCSTGELESIDLSKNYFLETLNVDDNKLTQLDLTNPNLKVINCEDNKLTSLDLSNSPKLYELVCSENKISSLDLTKNTKLSEINYSKNPIGDNITFANPEKLHKLVMNDVGATSLDLSKFPNLKILVCDDNMLTSLDFSNLTNLEDLNVEKNQLSSIDVTACKKLEVLDCSDNYIQNLDLSQQERLYRLDCGNTGISQLILPANVDYVKDMYLNDNKFETLSLPDMPALETLVTSGNKLTSLTLGNYPKLTSLYLDNALIDNIDLSGYPKLKYLSLANVPITSLSLSDEQKSTIERLNISSTKITNVQDIVSGLENVDLLSLRNLKLSGIDLSDCSKLEALLIDDNNIATSDAIKMPALEEHSIFLLSCANNNMEKLDFDSWEIYPIFLDCHNNNLKSLAIRLPYCGINCSNNQLSHLDLSAVQLMFVPKYVTSYDDVATGRGFFPPIQMKTSVGTSDLGSYYTLQSTSGEPTGVTFGRFENNGIELFAEKDINGNNYFRLDDNVTYKDYNIAERIGNGFDLNMVTWQNGGEVKKNDRYGKILSLPAGSEGSVNYNYNTGYAGLNLDVYIFFIGIFNYGGDFEAAERAVEDELQQGLLNSAPRRNALANLSSLNITSSVKKVRPMATTFNGIDYADLPFTLKWYESNITGINTMLSDAKVVSVEYINAAGLRSTEPTKGFNIVITTMDDGSRTITKMVK